MNSAFVKNTSTTDNRDDAVEGWWITWPRVTICRPDFYAPLNDPRKPGNKSKDGQRKMKPRWRKRIFPTTFPSMMMMNACLVNSLEGCEKIGFCPVLYSSWFVRVCKYETRLHRGSLACIERKMNEEEILSPPSYGYRVRRKNRHSFSGMDSSNLFATFICVHLVNKFYIFCQAFKFMDML